MIIAVSSHSVQSYLAGTGVVPGGGATNLRPSAEAPTDRHNSSSKPVSLLPGKQY